jgi:predicted deacylase
MSLLPALIILSAQAKPVPPLDVWVRAGSPEDRAVLSDLDLGFVEGQIGDWWHMHGEPDAREDLQRSGLRYIPAARAITAPDTYRTPGQMVSALERLAEDNQETSQLIDIGISEQGRPIVGLRIGRSEFPDHRIRILGAHHGDEKASAALAFEAASRLLSDPDLIPLLDTTEVWVVPHINPDGVAAHSRYNANNVDLNRNYDFAWSPSSFRPGPSPFSESETAAIRALGSWVDFGLGLSMHSGAINIGWVWNYTTDLTADEALLSHIGSTYAEDCTAEGFWITNGAAWYITHGDTTDWSFGRHGTLDFTLEVSTTKSPAADQLAEVIEAHEDAVLAVLAWPWWIAGSVVDAMTGMGVAASIEVDGTDQPIVTGPDGAFSRPVEDGIWTLTVSAPGYLPATLTRDVHGSTEDIALTPSTLSTNWPEDRWLSADGQFQLTEPATAVSLIRAGAPAAIASETTTGWRVEHDALQPGPYTVMIDGSAAPHALFVPEWGGAAHIASVSVDGETITLEIPGLGRGAQAWALWGTRRNLSPMAVLDQVADRLVLDGRFLPLETTEVDLVVWTQGMQLGIANVKGDGPDVGPDEPPPEEVPPDTGSAPDPDDPDVDIPPIEAAPIIGGGSKLSAGGCQVGPSGYPGLMWLVSLLAVCRRTPCESDQ